MKKQSSKAKRLTEIKKSFKKLQRLMENHLNEALNKDLKDFGTDLKKFLESKDLKVKLAKGDAQPYYEPIGKKPSFAALVLGNQDTELYVIVNDSKIDVLEDLIKKYNLKTLQSLKQTGGWDDDPNKKTQSEGEIFINSEKPQRKGKAFELTIRRFNPSDIKEIKIVQ